ncbi:hypothetical protein BSM4216_2623 [Bacillus smithii]|nr:hypothetical protein BSM4216_2623 [Bacillus smithii]
MIFHLYMKMDQKKEVKRSKFAHKKREAIVLASLFYLR